MDRQMAIDVALEYRSIQIVLQIVDGDEIYYVSTAGERELPTKNG